MTMHIDAHKYCSNHKQLMLDSKLCGCFYCLSIFPPEQIDFWIDEYTGTAVCPYCRIDSVIGDASGYPVTVEFLKKMNGHWF